MTRAIKFYTKALGAKVLMRGTGQMRNYWSSIRVGDSEFWLIGMAKPEKRTLAYTTFCVKNIDATAKKLQASGVRFERPERMGPETKIEGPVAHDRYGSAAFFKDSEGNLLMLWQAPASM